MRYGPSVMVCLLDPSTDINLPAQAPWLPWTRSFGQVFTSTMAAVEHHTFNMMPRHISEEHEQFGSIYPDPPQGTFSSAGLDMGLTSEAFDPRLLPVTMGGYEQNPFAIDGPAAWAYGDRLSPPVFHDDSELGAHLSPASENSPSSSPAGSPRSTHDQPAPIPDWAAHGVMSPGIVDSQGYYAAGTEYSFAPAGMEDLAPFTFADTSKPPGFVGELPQTPTTSTSGPQSQQHSSGGPLSPCVSRRESTSVLFSEAGPAVASPSEPAYGQTTSSPISPSLSRKFSVFTPSDSSISSSPTAPAWTSPTTRHVSPFFSQSSGHFIAPLVSSCWFP